MAPHILCYRRLPRRGTSRKGVEEGMGIVGGVGTMGAMGTVRGVGMMDFVKVLGL